MLKPRLGSFTSRPQPLNDGLGSLSMTASAAASAPATDEVTPYARKALIASTAGYAMDGFAS